MTSRRRAFSPLLAITALLFAAGCSPSLSVPIPHVAAEINASSIGHRLGDIAPPVPTAQTCRGLPYTPGGVASNAAECTILFEIGPGVCGTPPYPGAGWTDVIWATAPWESTAPGNITIRDADVWLYYNNSTFFGTFMGNSYQPDPVTPYAVEVMRPGASAGTVHAHHSFPAGGGMQFPAWTGITNPTQTYHLDAHGWCPNGSGYSGYAYVTYTIP